jgi:hypothetical protein
MLSGKDSRDSAVSLVKIQAVGGGRRVAGGGLGIGSFGVCCYHRQNRAAGYGGGSRVRDWFVRGLLLPSSEPGGGRRVAGLGFGIGSFGVCCYHRQSRAAGHGGRVSGKGLSRSEFAETFVRPRRLQTRHLSPAARRRDCYNRDNKAVALQPRPPSPAACRRDCYERDNKAVALQLRPCPPPGLL